MDNTPEPNPFESPRAMHRSLLGARPSSGWSFIERAAHGLVLSFYAFAVCIIACACLGFLVLHTAGITKQITADSFEIVCLTSGLIGAAITFGWTITHPRQSRYEPFANFLKEDRRG